MKKTKRIISLLLSFVMILSLTAAVSVSEVYAATIKLSYYSVNVKTGKTVTLKLMNGKKQVKAANVKWKSKNTSIAEVSSKGVIKGKKAGSTKIVAKYKNKSYICRVNVKDATSKSVSGTDLERNGDYIVFGHYEQDGDASNGAEPIEWEVLDESGGELLLISRYILDTVPYNNEFTDVTWETCTLRDWLNDDFYNKAFSKKEKAKIVKSSLKNPDNARWGTEGGNSTKDNVFLLSVPEIMEYYDFNTYYDKSHPDEYGYYDYGYSQALMTEGTKYAVDRGLYTWTMDSGNYYRGYEEEGYDTSCIGKTCGRWWLRSPGYFGSYACFVYYFGFAGWGSYDGSVVCDDVGVRPALRIKL